MSAKTGIEWTDATFNPWWGCTKVSPGCDHCYAEGVARRFGTVWGANATRREFGDKHWNEPRHWNARAEREGRRLRVFCASMADVFDNDAPTGARDRLFALIRETPRLDWQILTKRIGNAAKMLPDDWGNGYPNVWLGATVVNQDEADRDVPKLLGTPASIRFLSCEPLLGPINFRWQPYPNQATGEDYRTYLERRGSVNELESLRGIGWIIAGGESGHGARPMDPAWVRLLRDQCATAGVPFFFKQWGEHAPNWFNDEDGNRIPGSEWIDRMGKRAAGKTLDGRTHLEFPAVEART